MYVCVCVFACVYLYVCVYSNLDAAGDGHR